MLILAFFNKSISEQTEIYSWFFSVSPEILFITFSASSVFPSLIRQRLYNAAAEILSGSIFKISKKIFAAKSKLPFSNSNFALIKS